MKMMRMQPEDLDAVIKIEEKYFSDPWSKQSFLQSLEQNYAVLVVARQEPEIAGYGCLYQIADEGEILKVAVSPHFRQQGIGLMLVDALLEAGRQLGGRTFILDVRQSNEAALKLYTKAGFQKVCLQKDFYEKPREDGWLMTLDLSGN